MIRFASPMYGDEEKKALQEVITEQGILTNGPKNKQFADSFSEYIGARLHVCIPVSSCMAALHLSYLALGIGPGDEVIVPAMTHVATVHAVELVGATPVFVDCERHTGNISPLSIERAITRRTKAVSVVHFLGILCEMPKIKNLCNDYGLYLVEDCALALGTKLGQYNIHAGVFGDFGCFSLYPCKHITTGEGGMIVCHKKHEERVRRILEFGKVNSKPYDIVDCGLNYRMDEFSAALGVVQLRRFQEEKWLDRRLSNADTLRKAIYPFCKTVIAGSYAVSAYFFSKHLRDKVQETLAMVDIETSIYYPRPVPAFTYYKNKYGYAPTRYPKAIAIADTSLTLPVGPHLTEDNMMEIAEIIKETVSL